MSDIAIDIVLLPPPELLEKCYALNAQLSDRRIDLAPGKGMPHISLFMGCVSEEDIPEICEKLRELASKFSPATLQGHIRNYENSDRQQLTEILIPDSQKLKELFFAIARLQKYAHYASTEEMVQGEHIDPGTLFWINTIFPKKFKDYDLFKPHITLGFGQLPEEEFTFKSTELGLFRLGNWCTCQEELGRFRLDEKP